MVRGPSGAWIPAMDDQFDRSFATAINRTYSRENLFNVLKYENGSSMKGIYLQLTEISIAEKEAIHSGQHQIRSWTDHNGRTNNGRTIMDGPIWTSIQMNLVTAKDVCCLSNNRLRFHFSVDGYYFCIGLFYGQGLSLKIHLIA